MRPHGPAWERRGAHSAHPRLPHPLPAGPGPGHHGRCFGWWNPVPGGSVPPMAEPGCDWRGRRGAPVGYPSCRQRKTGQAGIPRQSESPVPLIFHCPVLRSETSPKLELRARAVTYRCASNPCRIIQPSPLLAPKPFLPQTVPSSNSTPPNCPLCQTLLPPNSATE